jgi:hypothetical protein
MDIMTRIDTANLTQFQMELVVASSMAAGLIYCFVGYKLLKFVLGLTGFIIAGSVAVLLVSWATDGHAISMIVALIIGGTSGAFALFFLFRTGIFAVGMLGMTIFSNNFLGDRPESWTPLAIVGLGIVGGLIALVLERPVLALATATIGSWMIVAGGTYFIDTYFNDGATQITDIRDAFRVESDQMLQLVVWAVLAATGFTAQLSITNDKDDD